MGDLPEDSLYEHLHRLAERAMAREPAGHTLQPTALVHEAWLRVPREMKNGFAEREHFLALAARAMRRALVDHARRRMVRSAGGERVTLSGLPGESETLEGVEVLELHAALTELTVRSARQAQVVELRWFAGLTFEQIGREVGVSDRTAKEDWRVARAWLSRRLGGEGGP